MIQRGDPVQVPFLVLYPEDRNYSPSRPETYVDTLTALGLLGSHWRNDRYQVGERFLDLITFLGCAPSIELTPQPDINDFRFCHIRLPDPADTHRLIISRLAPPPRCPICKTARPAEAQGIKSLLANTQLKCPSCGHIEGASQWVWRKKQSFQARYWIEILNIYESEAVPNPQLLDHLRQIDDVAWNSCYITP